MHHTLTIGNLVPKRGSNLRKYQKRKKPQVQERYENSMNEPAGISYNQDEKSYDSNDANDEEIQSIVFQEITEDTEMPVKEEMT